MKTLLDTSAYVAAQTIEHGAELITTDRHFEKIAGLV